MASPSMPSPLRATQKSQAKPIAAKTGTKKEISMTNSTTSTTSSSSAHPGRDGMTLLKAVVRPAWRQQPRNFDFSIFAGRDFRALDFAWRDGRPARHQYDKNAMYVGAASSVV